MRWILTAVLILLSFLLPEPLLAELPGLAPELRESRRSASALMRAGRIEEAREELRALLSRARELEGSSGRSVGLLLHEEGAALRALRRFGEARTSLQQAWDILDLPPRAAARTRMRVAKEMVDVLLETSRYEEAEEWLARYRKVTEEAEAGPADQADMAYAHSVVLAGLQRRDEALRWARRCVEEAGAARPSHPHLRFFRSSLARMLKKAGRTSEAIEELRALVASCQERFDCHMVRRTLSESLRAAGHLQEAIPEARRALAGAREEFGVASDLLVNYERELARAIRQEDPEEARRLLLSALAAVRQQHGLRSRMVVSFLNDLGGLWEFHRNPERIAECRRFFQEAIEIASRPDDGDAVSAAGLATLRRNLERMDQPRVEGAPGR